MIACVIFYNDGPLLEDSLKSLVGKVDQIIAVDGAFSDFPHEKPYSTDGSLEIAEKYATVIKTKKAWKTQVDKRNAYLKHVPDGECFIVIDADEELWGKIPHEGNLKVYIKPEANRKGYWWPRIFIKTPELRYYKTHMSLFNEDGLVNHEAFKKVGVTIYHKHRSRPTQRMIDKETYRKIHNEKEMKYREKFVNEMHRQTNKNRSL